ncbi:ribbon-helix-helix protein, CopG family [Thiohalocapsa sp. ML1]|jgi:hypothetical protein|uniref:ribbon-helix-helix protein, CopG family n=1 Tax=Thiohalocapsa sp. ML1 TaxID=1431688 RepID=UPI001C1F78B1|nr:ribbon-helix-helix protein, CopG family [Thiohalocapsa sp. ML1]
MNEACRTNLFSSTQSLRVCPLRQTRILEAKARHRTPLPPSCPLVSAHEARAALGSLALRLHHSGVGWCIINGRKGHIMAKTPKTSGNQRTESKTARASISFPAELYDALERIATEKKVSVAWVVREAVSEYVVDKAPAQGRN